MTTGEMDDMGDYEELAIEFDGYQLVLSNMGGEKKLSRVRLNRRNRENCIGCGEKLSPLAKYGICSKCQDDSEVEASKFKRHPRDWIATIAPPGNDPADVREEIVDYFSLTQTLINWTENGRTEDEISKRRKVLDEFVHNHIEEQIPGKIPDSTALQEFVEGDVDEIDGCYYTNGPGDVIETVRATVDSVFPQENYKNEFLRMKMDGLDDEKGSYEVPLRIVAGLYYLGIACEEANRGDRWYIDNIMNGDKTPGAAGAYMTLGHYVMFRHTNASPEAVRKTVR